MQKATARDKAAVQTYHETLVELQEALLDLDLRHPALLKKLGPLQGERAPVLLRRWSAAGQEGIAQRGGAVAGPGRKGSTLLTGVLAGTVAKLAHSLYELSLTEGTVLAAAGLSSAEEAMGQDEDGGGGQARAG